MSFVRQNLFAPSLLFTGSPQLFEVLVLKKKELHLDLDRFSCHFCHKPRRIKRQVTKLHMIGLPVLLDKTGIYNCNKNIFISTT